MVSPDMSEPRRSLPIVLLLLLAVALVLYVLMLANALHPSTGGGEARMGDAFEALFLIAGLWIVLSLMLMAGGLGGAMPRWAAILAVILMPVSAVAAAVAIDMCSRHMEWAVVFLVLLPALIVFYAFWARLPGWRAALPAERTSTAVWGAIFFLSVAAFVLGA